MMDLTLNFGGKQKCLDGTIVHRNYMQKSRVNIILSVESGTIVMRLGSDAPRVGGKN